MMVYYLKSKGGGVMEIGTDNGFGVFWAEQGFKALMNAIENHPEKLESLEIIDQQRKMYKIETFLDKVGKLKIRTQ